MKRSRIAIALVLLMGTVLLLSGTLLVLYADHCCSGAHCAICPALTQCAQWLLGVCAICASWVQIKRVGLVCSSSLTEKGSLVNWTLVCRKVELLI